MVSPTQLRSDFPEHGPVVSGFSYSYSAHRMRSRPGSERRGGCVSAAADTDSDMVTGIDCRGSFRDGFWAPTDGSKRNGFRVTTRRNGFRGGSARNGFLDALVRKPDQNAESQNAEMPNKFHRDQNAESQNAERQNAESQNAERQNAERQNAELLRFYGQCFHY